MLLYNESFFKANGYGYACFHIIASSNVLSRFFFFEIIQENDRKKISSYNFHFQFVEISWYNKNQLI